MGRKSNLRKKFGAHKNRDKDGGSSSNNNRPISNEDGESSRRSIAGNVRGEDRISNFPERVLGDILSRLNIEEAVRTCILSRDWRNKWTHINNLKFCDGFPFTKNKYLKFVERVLNKVLCIKDFVLVCFHNQDQSQVKEILSAALNSDVLESLHVAFLEAKTNFSASFFNSNSLIKLELFACTLSVSAKICLNHLRFLNLCGVEIQNQVSSSGRLLFMMPILEEFKLQGCNFSNVKSLQIHAPVLSCLEVINCQYDSKSQIDGTHEQYVIEITGFSSIKFTNSGALEEKFTFSSPSAISSVSLSLHSGVKVVLN